MNDNSLTRLRVARAKQHMCHLPSVEVAGADVRLPISNRCAIELLCWMAGYHSVNDQTSPSERIEKIIARCPSTLIWSTCHATTLGGNSLSLSQLVTWFQEHAIPLLAAENSDQNATYDRADNTYDKLSKRIRKYFASLEELSKSDRSIACHDDSAEIVCHLGKLLSRLSAFKKSQATSWLNDRLVEGFWIELADVFGQLGVTPRRLAKQWREEAIMPDSLTEIAQLASVGCSESTRESSEFQRQLHLQKMASLKQLAYGASHEINNPLANIASRAQTLLLDETDPERRRKLQSINQQAFRAHEMIADMMLFAHPPELSIDLINPAQVVGEAVQEIQPAADDQATNLVVHEISVPEIHADRTQLTVAIKALIQNAIEVLRESGQVEISVQHDVDDGWLVIRVADDGPGIDPEHHQHLFDPFFSGREAGRGLGFGLSKAWRIVELHGGDLIAKNRTPKGALFEIRIPYAGAD